MNWQTKAGPHPVRAQAPSMRLSSRRSMTPAPARAAENSSSSRAVTRGLASQSTTPAPTAQGVLGMMRMTGQSPPAISAMRAMVSPAAMVTSTNRSCRAASTGATSASSPPIIWGLTPRKI